MPTGVQCPTDLTKQLGSRLRTVHHISELVTPTLRETSASERTHAETSAMLFQNLVPFQVSLHEGRPSSGVRIKQRCFQSRTSALFHHVLRAAYLGAVFQARRTRLLVPLDAFVCHEVREDLIDAVAGVKVVPGAARSWSPDVCLRVIAMPCRRSCTGSSMLLGCV